MLIKFVASAKLKFVYNSLLLSLCHNDIEVETFGKIFEDYLFNIIFYIEAVFNF